jgi:acyl-CoA thioesterase-1
MPFARSSLLLLAISGALLVGCTPGPPDQAARDAEAAAAAVVAPDRVPASRRIVIAFLGDSLTAGAGLMTNQAYPALIGEMFAAEGYDMVEILNAGVTGDTTAGGVRRLDQVLAPDVRILVVALGGNDALRGLTVAQTEENLSVIIERALANGTEVLLAGMEGPTNLGDDYRLRFRGAFAGLAQSYRRQIFYVPFLLEGVAGLPHLNQPDGIHPNEQGARLVAEHLYPTLRNMVDLVPTPDTLQ